MKSEIISSYTEEPKKLYNPRLGIVINGDDNLKPLAIENLIDSSPTAFQCAWLYERFLGGAGFEVDLSKINLGNEILPYSPNNLLYDVCEPMSRHQGVFILVGYNANFQKDHFKIIPYSLCRIGKKDSKDYYGKILVSPNGWGKSLKKEEIDVFDVYNPKPVVIAEQVSRDGGWENYKGQILFFKFSYKYDYPKSMVEIAYLFADTENKLGLYYNSTTKGGFENTTFLRHRKFESEKDKKQFLENVKDVTGIDKSSRVLAVEDDWDDEREKTGNFKFDTLPNTTKADKYAHFESSSANFIRKAFKNIPPQLVDYVAGKLGNTSGEDLIKAQAVYNAIISRDQEKIELLFAELFTNYKDNINPSGNWTIKQYSLLDDGTVNYNTASPKMSVENQEQKTKATLLVASSVKNNEIDFESGVYTLQYLLGYSFDEAVLILKPYKN
ncbi:hypothetical protein [Flavobacterium sp.]|uniref:hypothetical protein n=1 Tax=Flavobacterium sp. TaxID=239 RepID=UPI002614359D|nr:hypothetical protein [Flavobacterium sp.]